MGRQGGAGGATRGGGGGEEKGDCNQDGNLGHHAWIQHAGHPESCPTLSCDKTATLDIQKAVLPCPGTKLPQVYF